MKKEIRVIGIDDCPFDKFRDKKTVIIGAVFRGGHFLDGVVSGVVQVDGDDSADRIAKLVQNTKFRAQLQAVFLDGIAVAGFNIVDIEKLSKMTMLPVIAVMRNYPDNDKIKDALIKTGMEEKLELINKAGRIRKAGSIFYQAKGTDPETAEEMIKITSTRSNLPEPVRTAHLMAQGLAFGESRGRA